MPGLHSTLFRRVARVVGSLAAVLAITTANFRLFHVNSATAAFSYLLLILALATRFGLEESIAASIASVLCYNFFFLPPIGTFTIADPQNWVALCVFVITAVTASQLSAHARRRAEEARARQLELERIHDFSRALMLGDTEQSVASQISRQLAHVFDIPAVSFYELSTGKSCSLGNSTLLVDSRLEEVAATNKAWTDALHQASIIPVHLGGRILGSLGVAGAGGPSEVALRAVAHMAAIAIERARSQQAATLAEATRQHEELKSTLLDALAHEFKTPLTTIKAVTGTMLLRQNLETRDHELLTLVDESSDRLTRLVTESIQVARIGTGQIRLNREPCSIDELISLSVAQLRVHLEERDLQITLEDHLPTVDIDKNLSSLLLRQLLDNALKYAPASSPIRIHAVSSAPFVVLSIGNDGPGIARDEQSAIFTKFYRGSAARDRIPGTGMGLTIARGIAQAQGGDVWLESDSAHGVKFSLTLPIQSDHSERSDVTTK